MKRKVHIERNFKESPCVVKKGSGIQMENGLRVDLSIEKHKFLKIITVAPVIVSQYERVLKLSVLDKVEIVRFLRN